MEPIAFTPRMVALHRASHSNQSGGDFVAGRRKRPTAEPFGYCFNTSTIREKKLPLDQVVEIVAQAGYQGIEPWIGEIDTYVKAGGSLADLRKRISDAGLSVESAIGFAAFLVDDEQKREGRTGGGPPQHGSRAADRR